MMAHGNGVGVKLLFCAWIFLAVAGLAAWSYRHPVLMGEFNVLSAIHPGHGHAPAAVQEAPPAPQPPPVNVPLRLVGVLLPEEVGAHGPIAVIQDLQRCKMNLYETGNLISDEMVVSRVTKTDATICFLRDGQSFTLSLEDQISDRVGRGLIVSYLSTGERVVERQAMQREGIPVFLGLIQKAIASPIRWKGLAGGIDAMGSTDGVLRALGLERSDRIVAVNGRPLEGYRHALQLLVEAVAGPSLMIDLIRTGYKQKKLTYRLTS